MEAGCACLGLDRHGMLPDPAREARATLPIGRYGVGELHDVDHMFLSQRAGENRSSYLILQKVGPCDL